jgi:hypothetical protein
LYGDVLGLEEIPKPAALATRCGVWFRGDGLEIYVGIEEPFVAAKKARPGILTYDLEAVRGHENRSALLGGGSPRWTSRLLPPQRSQRWSTHPGSPNLERCSAMPAGSFGPFGTGWRRAAERSIAL